MSHESKDASLRVIGTGAAIVALLVVASLGTVSWMYVARSRGPASTAPRQTSFTRGAGQRTGIRDDYAQVTRTAGERLHGYAWVDRDAGVVRIPVDRAMELMVAGVKPAPAPKEPGP